MDKIKYFDISWLSSVDGQGARVVLFLSGCHLRCSWCHSPHSWSTKPTLLYFETHCQNCQNCLKSCPNEVHQFVENIHTLNRKNCSGCGKCINQCPSSQRGKWSTSALGIAYHELKVEELYKLLTPQLKLLKSIGGITISGGDPLLQSDSLSDLLKLCREDDIHTAIETSATLELNRIKKLLPFVDHWLIGVRPSKIDKSGNWDNLLENLKYLAKVNTQNITIRTPIIPEYTDSKETCDLIIDVMKSNSLKNIELLPFNPYSENYYSALGLSFPIKNIKPPEKIKVEEIKKKFLLNDINAKILN